MSYNADKYGQIDYAQRCLSTDLNVNVEILGEIFLNDATFQSRVFSCQRNADIKCAIFYMDGMSSSKIINESIIQPITTAWLEDKPHLFKMVSSSVIAGNLTTETDDIKSLVEALLYGDSVVLVNGFAMGVIVNSKEFTLRSVSEPDDEKALRGPREGFTEGLMVNASLIRRRLQTSDLKFKAKSFGTRSNTKAFLCYLDSLVDKDILAELEKRLESISIDGVLDVNYIQEFIRDSPYSIFKTAGSTEKPDIVAAKLLEGRVALLLDGTPIVMTVPYLFIENLQVADDYYNNFYYSTLGRILRLFGFWITVSVPAIYVALIAFHPETIPTPLMLSMAAAINKAPFPTVVECAGMLIVFEILRETGIRTPNKIGQALSIVGALIVGQAAVEAKIVSAPVVIVVALTGITGLMIPRLSGAVIMIRLSFMAAAAILGFYGYFLASIFLFFYLTGIKSFGIDYTSQLFTYNPKRLKDIYMRAPMPQMDSRPLFMSQDTER